MWCGRDRVGRSHSVDVVGDDDGYASSDLDGGDELGEKKVVDKNQRKVLLLYTTMAVILVIVIVRKGYDLNLKNN